MKVLFVCLGNICRSPVAEAIFNSKVLKLGLNAASDSCGTANYHVGDNPDLRSVNNAQKNGIIIRHKGRQIRNEDLINFDFILAMDKNNLREIMNLPKAKNNEVKIMLMRKFDPIGANEDVPDPYYGSEMDFQNVFEILDRSVEEFIRVKVKELL